MATRTEIRAHVGELILDREPGGPAQVLTLDRLLTVAAQARRPVRLLVETKHPTRYGEEVEQELVTTLRRHGLDHPDPDTSGDFHLTPKQEERLRASAPLKARQQADKDCFHLLKGTVSTKPLSKAAMRAALVPLRDLKRCLKGFGYDVGKPTVQNLPRGRAMFGFDQAGPTGGTKGQREKRHDAQLTCEKRVQR